MADVKISELPALTSVSAADEFVVNDGGTTKKITSTNLLGSFVEKTASTGAINVPVGTTGQRPSAANGLFRFNSTTSKFEGYNGSEWGEIGGGGETSIVTFKFIATNNQTTFTGADFSSVTLTYTASNIIVLLNGITLDASDYTASNGSSIILGTGADTGDELVVVAFKTFTVADHHTKTAADARFLGKAGGTMTGNLVLSAANSQVGIGTDNMQIFNSVGGSSGLVVTGVSSSTAILGNTLSNITIANGDGTANNTAALHFAREDTDGNPNYAGASIVSQFKETQATGQYPKADLAFLTSTSANSAPSEKMRIDSSGHAIIPAGVTLGTAAGVYSAANTLDDYEEGTFTATLLGSSGNPSTAVTTTSQYRKIGEIVYITIAFENVNTTGANGAIEVSGLPFTSKANGRYFISNSFYNGTTWPSSSIPTAYVEADSTKINCFSIRSNNIWVDAAHNAGSGGNYFWFSGTYPTGA